MERKPETQMKGKDQKENWEPEEHRLKGQEKGKEFLKGQKEMIRMAEKELGRKFGMLKVSSRWPTMTNIQLISA